ncbi:MAG: aminotransferase class V [Acidobacteria bacterium]|nr:MAG: aminotransferase class V [Acidobacteriota bacterium]
MELSFEDFGPFEGRVWLNCAHQGPIPKVAVQELMEAVAWKVAPHHLTNSEKFKAVPQRLRTALGNLVGVPGEEIILGNSTSYGLHLLANGIRWKSGDEILLVKGDFPSCILPWLALEKLGVIVRYVEPRNHVLQSEELVENLTPQTKLLCTTSVHSFSGYSIDVDAIGKICQTNGIKFILNCTQALGARPLNLASTSVDAIVGGGHKWLCGPYGTGFCWMRNSLLDSLEYNQAYWLAMQSADDLGGKQTNLSVRTDLKARAYDVFGTANFFNFKTWTASIEYLLAKGIDQIAAYDNSLVSHFIDGIDLERYELISPPSGPSRSTLIFISHRSSDFNDKIYQELKQAKVDVAYRTGNIRLSPHLYNTTHDIDHVLSLLNAFSNVR